MRSRAAIANHPLHPLLVTVPIGAFLVALVGDVAFILGGERVWFELSRAPIGIGIVFAHSPRSSARATTSPCR